MLLLVFFGLHFFSLPSIMALIAGTTLGIVNIGILFFLISGMRAQPFSNHSAGDVESLIDSFEQLKRRFYQREEELKRIEQKLSVERRRTLVSEKTKQNFLINISHEIRTPMNGILGFARLLEDTIKEKEHQESLQMIIKSADHLMAILNDILDFSRIEAGDINFAQQPFELKDTVLSIYKLMEATAKLKGIEFKCFIDPGVPTYVNGDAIRLGQILLNLTSNALKFTEHGQVNINVFVIEERGDQTILEFRVSDTGIGIPLHKQERIFDYFEQAANGTSRKFGGTGLGLSIVKRLVELQKGHIYVKSFPEKGSDFYFRLPFSKVKDLNESDVTFKSPQLEDVSEVGKGTRILVVEDNPINQLLVIKLLERRGYEATVVPNGRLALEEYQEKTFDIVLMDLQMPEMDGYEATAQIRKLPEGKREVPIVAMTAHTVKGELEKCMAIGMNDYISKPFNSTELYYKIELLLENKVTPGKEWS